MIQFEVDEQLRGIETKNTKKTDEDDGGHNT